MEDATQVAAVATAAAYVDQPKEVELRQEQEDSEVVVPKSKLEMAKEEEAEQEAEQEAVEDTEKKVNNDEVDEKPNDTAKVVDGDAILKSLPKKKKRRRHKKKKSSSNLADDSAVLAGSAAVASSEKTIAEETPSKPLEGGICKI